MAEYIERDCLIDMIAERNRNTCNGKMSCIQMKRMVESIPVADVAPVRHGRWIETGYACGENEYQCSECKETEWRTSASRLKYCPFCGAKMDGGAD